MSLKLLKNMWFFLMFSFSFKVAGWLISFVRRFTNPGQGAKIKWDKYQLHLALFIIDPKKPVCTKSYEIMNWSQALESVCLQQSPEAHFAAQNQTNSMGDICSSMPYRPAWRTLPRLSHHSLAVWRSLGSRGIMWPCSLDASFTSKMLEDLDMHRSSHCPSCLLTNAKPGVFAEALRSVPWWVPRYSGRLGRQRSAGDLRRVRRWPAIWRRFPHVKEVTP